MSRERPILFSAPMVRAILEGRKTQTRRVVKFEHAAEVDAWAGCDDGAWEMGVCEAGSTASMGKIPCPYGTPGDRLWVRETWAWPGEEEVLYRASHQHIQDRMKSDPLYPQFAWKPSIYMPRWASRLTLEVTDVRVERLQDISEKDATAEGVDHLAAFDDGLVARADWPESGNAKWFRALWESINGPGSWDSNPWVWVVGFKRLEAKTEAA